MGWNHSENLGGCVLGDGEHGKSIASEGPEQNDNAHWEGHDENEQFVTPILRPGGPAVNINNDLASK